MATIKLNTQEFKDQVFDFENEQDWKFKGGLPAIVDFYADWCGPILKANQISTRNASSKVLRCGHMQ